MKDSSFISSYVILRDGALLRDGIVVHEDRSNSGADFLDRAYSALGLNYPRFHKMDNLCKTGFLASELLLQNRDWKGGLKPEEIGIVLSNAHSSLDTDLRYEDSIASAPSPSLFVYTLPNVLIGELCIRQQIKGETACFVFDIFDAAFQAGYVNTLFEAGRSRACISGWADYYDGKAAAFFYLVEPNPGGGSQKHNSETLEKIYHS